MQRALSALAQLNNPVASMTPTASLNVAGESLRRRDRGSLFARQQQQDDRNHGKHKDASADQIASNTAVAIRDVQNFTDRPHSKQKGVKQESVTDSV